jgi:hypothetical protein
VKKKILKSIIVNLRCDLDAWRETSGINYDKVIQFQQKYETTATDLVDVQLRLEDMVERFEAVNGKDLEVVMRQNVKLSKEMEIITAAQEDRISMIVKLQDQLNAILAPARCGKTAEETTSEKNLRVCSNCTDLFHCLEGSKRLTCPDCSDEY